MSKRTIVTASIALLAATLLAAPANLEAGIGDGIKRLNPFASTEETLQPNTIRFINTRAAKRIRVESITATRTETDNLQVDVLFYNKAKKPMQLAVRSLFFDERRTLAEAAGAWRVVHIQPRSVAGFSTRSISQGEAASFILEVQGDIANGYR